MKITIGLKDGWRLGWTEFSGDMATAETGRKAVKLETQVPGDVHLDLMRAGLLPELYYGTNLDQAWWVEHKDWWYRTEFATPAESEGRRVILVFHGLDTFATVWVNGQPAGRAENMFIRHEFDVTPLLHRDGKFNDIVVRLASPAHSIRVDPAHGPNWWSPERVFCRKAQMSFGWDIAPRLMTAGLWRPVELVLLDTARLCNLWVRLLRREGQNAVVAVQAEVEWFAAAGGSAVVKGAVHGVPWQVEGTLPPGIHTLTTELTIPQAPLWNPIGYGQPNLLEVDAVLKADGRAVDRSTFKTGLKKLELVREPQPSGAESFRLRCNGQDIFITGLNWTPLDAIFARVTDQQITQRLEEVAGIGCNMLRVWGGGIYEPRHFYHECSRLGILIWQDFMMGCGWYPQTDDMCRTLDQEARQVVRDLRNEPCMGVWAGDNENDCFYVDLRAGNRLTRTVLAAVCRELDPDAPYVPSSPWVPSGRSESQSTREGDYHYYAHGTDYRGAHFDLKCRFLSEFGHLSLPSRALIRRYFPWDAQWPLTGATWKYHGANTIRVDHFRGPECILKALAAAGRPAPANLAEAITASQELQADAVCAWIEKYCADPEFGGFMLWNVHDCWPQQSDAVIDYLGHKKVIFKRLKKLYAKVRRARKP